MWQVAVSVLLSFVSKYAPGSAGTSTGRAGPLTAEEDRVERAAAVCLVSPPGCTVGLAVATRTRKPDRSAVADLAPGEAEASGMDALGV